jgi:hypothetical protein
LKYGIQSLIQSSQDARAVPLPSESRPLYEVIQEVKTSMKSNEIYAPGHSYVMNSTTEPEVNIQKTVEQPTEKEEDKKKKDKKDKYALKF